MNKNDAREGSGTSPKGQTLPHRVNGVISIREVEES